MNHSSRIKSWIAQDRFRMEALKVAHSLNLPNWCLAAGFVRNLVWDKLHNVSFPHELNDIDLIYFDPKRTDSQIDRRIECVLSEEMNLPWSVKNQARMHLRHSASPYLSVEDAMSYWPEVETAIGVRLEDNSRLKLIAPFGLDLLMSGSITRNSRCKDQNVFKKRLQEKQWLSIWPSLNVNG